MQNLFPGCWAVCQRGAVARIYAVAYVNRRTMYKGRRLDGSLWRSYNPRAITEPGVIAALEALRVGAVAEAELA